MVVAYLVPGFVVLWGASYLSPILRMWLATPPDNLPAVGGLLYVTVASLAAGMTVSAIRWAVFDTLHHRTGVAPPRWNFATLPEKLEAYQALIEIHYRYYQLHSHLLVAFAFAYVARFFLGERIGWELWTSVSLLSVSFCFLVRATHCGSITAGPANFSPSPAKGGES